MARGFVEGPQDLEHGGARAGAKVPAEHAGAVRDVVQGGEVPVGEVNHVDVVAQAGAVRGGVVVAEHHQLFAAADGHLGDEGHQVVGDALRVFADPAGRVGAHRVEVAQQGDVPAVVGRPEVGEDVLDLFLGAAVGVVGADLHLLDVGDGVVLAVDGGGGAEDDGAYAVPVHGAEQVQRADEVVVVVLQRLLDGLADSLQPGEVDHGVDRLSAKTALTASSSTRSTSWKAACLPLSSATRRRDFLAGVHQIVNDHNFMAAS